MGPTPRKKKGKNCALSELNRMLDFVERMLPFGSEQWENLAASTYQAGMLSVTVIV
ncbi:hypothetical protein PF005_g17569 [Phytophthora fragariae]|uniref:Uncharacterized protein n=1 Tax=Phytophthora fragariae TaxID=53985 RepID=A0A6A3X411_9STRA|nr:hypothetical protein PF011_g11049 [Phytophthora fragariae]KAE9194739.1 hypothetical protein PF005_g17569 [Phytophthora fragariae]KAE9244538.1 hypothetical protein PF002_g7702 [Phytophthora fragariae]